MTSKAARRRRRKITLPGGQSVPQRPTGRDRTHTHQPQEDARMTALTARARQHGITTDEAKAPWHGCAAGRAMAILRADEGRARLAAGRVDQRRGHAQPHLYRRMLARRLADRLDFGKLRAQPVHFPIACDQRTRCVCHLSHLVP